MKRFYYTNKKSVNQIAAFCLALLVGFIFFKYVFRLVAPFIVAFFLSSIISVPVDFISRKTFIPRAVSTAVSMVAILTVLGGVLYFAAALLTRQLLLFAGDFPSAFDSAVSIINDFQQSYYDFFAFLPQDFSGTFEESIVKIVPQVISAVGTAVKNSSILLMKFLPKTFVSMIITIIATFFMTLDKQRIRDFFKRQMPNNIKGTYGVLKDGIFSALWGYVRAQLILMSFSGTISVIGLSILGYTYAFLIGLCIAVVDALPVFGAGFILWPWALYNVLAGEYRFAIGLFCIYVVILVFRQFMEPKILSSQIGLHPLVTLLAMYVGLMLIGPLGIIAGPVFAIIVKTLQKAGALPDFK